MRHAAYIGRLQTAGSLSGLHFPQTPEGWPVYRPAATRPLPLCFWAARPPANAHTSPAPAWPRRPKTKRGWSLGRFGNPSHSETPRPQRILTPLPQPGDAVGYFGLLSAFDLRISDFLLNHLS
jgi:hypothetical protein